MESSSLHQLQQIPAVGNTIARDMLNIGIEDLKGLQAQQLYARLCDFKRNNRIFRYFRAYPFIYGLFLGVCFGLKNTVFYIGRTIKDVVAVERVGSRWG